MFLTHCMVQNLVFRKKRQIYNSYTTLCILQSHSSFQIYFSNLSHLIFDCWSNYYGYQIVTNMYLPKWLLPKWSLPKLSLPKCHFYLVTKRVVTNLSLPKWSLPKCHFYLVTKCPLPISRYQNVRYQNGRYQIAVTKYPPV